MPSWRGEIRVTVHHHYRKGLAHIDSWVWRADLSPPWSINPRGRWVLVCLARAVAALALTTLSLLPRGRKAGCALFEVFSHPEETDSHLAGWLESSLTVRPAKQRQADESQWAQPGAYIQLPRLSTKPGTIANIGQFWPTKMAMSYGWTFISKLAIKSKTLYSIPKIRQQFL